jgi:glycosyltransferase involved in cell wall biosynthesis
MKGLVTIIVPCYNQAQYLDDALQSVFDQIYQNWECIIVNDGSKDNSEVIAKKWVVKDSRFFYLYKENGGLSSARNLGLDNAKGDYIQFLDSDDFLDTRKLELSLNEFSSVESKGNNIVISNFRMFKVNLNDSKQAFCDLLPELLNFRSVLFKWGTVFSIPIHCGLFELGLFKDFRFPEELKAKEDWIMWLSLFQKELKVSFIDKPLVYYRLHEKSMTNSVEFMQENHLNSIIYIKNIIPEKDYLEYLCFEFLQKYNETKKLRTTIYNYQNSTTYRMAQKIKSTVFFKYFFQIIKK